MKRNLSLEKNKDLSASNFMKSCQTTCFGICMVAGENYLKLEVLKPVIKKQLKYIPFHCGVFFFFLFSPKWLAELLLFRLLLVHH